MPTTQKKDFHTSLTTKASATETTQKINDVAAWWGKKVKGSAQKQGDTYTITFGKTWATFRVTELIPGKKIVWLTTDCHLEWLKDKKEWQNHTMVWEISNKKGETQIDFTHVGLTPAIECYDKCNEGWTYHIHESLKPYLDTGKGEPYEG